MRTWASRHGACLKSQQRPLVTVDAQATGDTCYTTLIQSGRPPFEFQSSRHEYLCPSTNNLSRVRSCKSPSGPQMARTRTRRRSKTLPWKSYVRLQICETQGGSASRGTHLKKITGGSCNVTIARRLETIRMYVYIGQRSPWYRRVSGGKSEGGVRPGRNKRAA